MKKSAQYYAKNPKARAKKLAYDKKYQKDNKTSHNKTVRENSAKRRKAIKAGKNINGLDVAHTKNGTKFQKASSNRGSKTAMPGDRRARGKKNNKK